MNTQDDRLNEQVGTGGIHLQEQFGDGLQDASLPAAQVLTEQEEARTSNERAPLYIP